VHLLNPRVVEIVVVEENSIPITTLIVNVIGYLTKVVKEIATKEHGTKAQILGVM